MTKKEGSTTIENNLNKTYFVIGPKLWVEYTQVSGNGEHPLFKDEDIVSSA